MVGLVLSQDPLCIVVISCLHYALLLAIHEVCRKCETREEFLRVFDLEIHLTLAAPHQPVLHLQIIQILRTTHSRPERPSSSNEQADRILFSHLKTAPLRSQRKLLPR